MMTMSMSMMSMMSMRYNEYDDNDEMGLSTAHVHSIALQFES